jgi:hypothetical protein
MSRYYFDLTDSNGIALDEEGMELVDMDAVQDEAARALGDMTRDAARHSKGSAAEQMSIEVRDEAGPVMHVRFSFEIERKN